MTEDLFARVCLLGNSNEDAERIVRAVIAGLAETLPRAVRFLVAAELPRELRDVMLVHRERRAIEKTEFFAALSRRAGCGLVRAKEGGAVVCRALAELLPADVLARVVESVQPSMAELFTAPDYPRAVNGH